MDQLKDILNETQTKLNNVDNINNKDLTKINGYIRYINVILSHYCKHEFIFDRSNLDPCRSSKVCKHCGALL